MPGVRVHHSRSALALVSTLRECWSAPRADLFSFDLAVVPSAGFQRWLSQQLAQADGICAGVEFASLAGLRRRIDDDDPWQPERLVWPLQRLAQSSTDPALAELQRHLRASRERYSASLRIARHFAGYASHRPAMLAAWAAGEDVGPTGEPLNENTWQAHLWRDLAAALGETPGERQERLVTALRAAPSGAVPPRVAVIAPDQLGQPTMELLAALATHHQVELLALTPAPARRPGSTGVSLRRDFRRPIGHPLNDSLAAVADERALLLPPGPASEVAATVDTLLGWLQADLGADALPSVPRPLAANDSSVQLHLSHGLHRQVEVLREVLAGELASDPTLEPREIVVVTPRLDEVATLVTAAFMLPEAPGGHPGQSFRVRLADRSIAQTNPLIGVLLQLLELPDSRFEASTVLDLCAHPAIAARFGFREDQRDRLVELVQRSGIRWGLSAAQRADYGLQQYPQNTWLAGVQRMLLGVALDENELVTAGTVLPMDDIGSSDVDLIGGLAELIGRLSRWLTTTSSPGTIAEWAQRCRAITESLVSLRADEQWQLSDLWLGLARVAERGDAGLVGRHDARRVFADEFTDQAARGSFGSGALLVSGPHSLRHVPHRVTVLLGWDADRYPRTNTRHGDDLLGLAPVTGDPAAGLSDRQLLLDAVHATQERLIVIARSRSDATNEPVALAAPVQELLDALQRTAAPAAGTTGQQITVVHPLQPFDPSYFDPAHPRLHSVDQLAFRGALATSQPRPARNRYHLESLPAPDLAAGVSLDDLAAFFGHPVRQLLRHRAGFTLADPREPSDELPLELNGLEQWKIGDRVLRQLRAGAAPEAVLQAEWLRGEVPPAELGRRTLEQVMDQAGAALRRLPAEAAGAQARDLSITIDVPGHGPTILTGRVTTTGGQLLAAQYSSLQPKHRIAAWLRLLALSAAEGGHPQAVVVGKNGSVSLAAPPAGPSRRLLGRYLALYRLGLSEPLPAPPRAGERLAWMRQRGFDSQLPAAIQAEVARSWGWEVDAHWEAFFSFPDFLSIPADALPLPTGAEDETTLFGALAKLTWAPLLEAEARR